MSCLLVSIAAPGFAIAQTKLILPQNQGDIGKLIKNNETETCINCSTTTGANKENRERQQRSMLENPTTVNIDDAPSPTSISRAFDPPKNAKPPATYGLVIEDARAQFLRRNNQ
jgi:hypothetical protein